MNFNLSQENWLKVGKGVLIAMAGAGLTYMSEFASGVDFGMLTPVVVSAFSVAVNFLRKLKEENSVNVGE